MEKIKQSLGSVTEFVKDDKSATYGLAAVGALVVGTELAKCSYAVYKYFLRPAYDLRRRYGDHWAVVTGASDGIGKGYAFELARRGFKVGLIARNKEKLEAVAQEIREKYNVETKVVVFDFNTHYTDEKIKELAKLLDVFDKISIFINNVGCLSLDPLEKMEDDNIHEQINVIVVGTTVITKLVISKLQLNKNKSGLVFVGSNTYETGHPNLAVYSASKRYVYQLATSLMNENLLNIEIIFNSTSSVKSNMNSGRYLFTITPDLHAKGSLDKLGHDSVLLLL